MHAKLQHTETSTIKNRLSELDWPVLHQSLWDRGYALTAPLLSGGECGQLISLYRDDSNFRSHIIMSRYRFGQGDYKYFKYPLPVIIQDLREHSYPFLALLANEWNKVMGL